MFNQIRCVLKCMKYLTMDHEASESVKEQSNMEMAIMTEVETAATSTTAHIDSDVDLNNLKQEPGLVQTVNSEPALLVKEEILEDSSQDIDEQQCVQGALATTGVGSVYVSTDSAGLGDALNITDEDIDIQPTVLQRADTHYVTHQVIHEDCGNSSRTAIDSGNASEAQPGQTFIVVSDYPELIPTLPEPNTDIQNILQNQSILFQITNRIVENQKKIMHKLASLSVQMEESFSKIESRSTVSLIEASNAEKDSFILKQIKNVQDLKEMEQLLSDHERKMKLIKLCSIICSGGQGNGTNCAYRFLDVLFSRDFLCECSWSGSTRNDGVKISLKCYKNTLHFFFEMVNQWDTTYTHEANDKFFKNILKNATKRKTVKYQRIPTKRRRTKGVRSAKRQKTNDAANMVEDSGAEAINIPNNEYQINEGTIDIQPAIETNAEAKNKERVCDNEQNQSEEESLC